MPSVFLSHSHSDKAFVRQLGMDLATTNIRVWIDEGEIRAGESLIQKISSGIYEMNYLIAVLSRVSVQSRWVAQELDIAMNQEISSGMIKVMPVLVNDVVLPIFLSGKLYVDFTKQEQYQSSLNKLIRSIAPPSDELERIRSLEPKNTIAQFFQTVERWQLRSEAAASLLGVQVRTFHRLRHNIAVDKTMDAVNAIVIDRAIISLEISFLLDRLHSGNEERARMWLSTTHYGSLWNGKPPLVLLALGQMDRLIAFRDLLLFILNTRGDGGLLQAPG